MDKMGVGLGRAIRRLDQAEHAMWYVYQDHVPAGLADDVKDVADELTELLTLWKEFQPGLSLLLGP